MHQNEFTESLPSLQADQLVNVDLSYIAGRIPQSLWASVSSAPLFVKTQLLSRLLGNFTSLSNVPTVAAGE